LDWQLRKLGVCTFAVERLEPCDLTACRSSWPNVIGQDGLGEEPATQDELMALLKPRPDETLKIWPVDKKVGNVRNKGAELALPI
jgi:hypothetical protein